MVERIWEIDFIRGIALIGMLIFNWSFTLKFFNVYFLDLGHFFWNIFPLMVASTFIIISGISLKLSSQNKNFMKKALKRGIIIYLIGLLATFSTLIFIGKGFVLFGILHLIGISVLLGYYFINFEKLNLYIGALIILIGIYIQTFTVSFPWFSWLGLIPTSFYSVDHFSLFPWFGVFLIGMHFSKIFYHTKMPKNFIIESISKIGTKTLQIYILHQPLLILLLVFLGLI